MRTLVDTEQEHSVKTTRLEFLPTVDEVITPG